MLSTSEELARKTHAEVASSYYLYDVYYDDTLDPLRITNWDSAVSYGCHAYTPFAIKHGDITQKSDGQINDLQLTVGNADRQIQYYLENYDLIDKKVKITQVFVGVAETLEITYKIKSVTARKDTAVFVLSIGLDFLLAEAPRRIIRAKYCAWTFKDASCKYAGADTTCERSFEACKAKGNLTNFGGFPGIVNGRIYF